MSFVFYWIHLNVVFGKFKYNYILGRLVFVQSNPNASLTQQFARLHRRARLRRHPATVAVVQRIRADAAHELAVQLLRLLGAAVQTHLRPQAGAAPQERLEGGRLVLRLQSCVWLRWRRRHAWCDVSANVGVGVCSFVHCDI